MIWKGVAAALKGKQMQDEMSKSEQETVRDIAALALIANAASRPQTVHHHTTVKEQRAPTDESVRLLKEMEEAAREKLFASIPLEANGLNGQVVFDRNYMGMEITAHALLTINGKRIQVKHSEQSHRLESSSEAKAKFMEALRDKIAKEIANTFLIDALRETRLPF